MFNFKQSRILILTISIIWIRKNTLKSNSQKLRETSLNSLINSLSQITSNYCAHSSKLLIKLWIFAIWDRCKTYTPTSNLLSRVKLEGNLHLHIWGRFSASLQITTTTIGSKGKESANSSSKFLKTWTKSSRAKMKSKSANWASTYLSILTWSELEVRRWDKDFLQESTLTLRDS